MGNLAWLFRFICAMSTEKHVENVSMLCWNEKNSPKISLVCIPSRPFLPPPKPQNVFEQKEWCRIFSASLGWRRTRPFFTLYGERELAECVRGGMRKCQKITSMSHKKLSFSSGTSSLSFYRYAPFCVWLSFCSFVWGPPSLLCSFHVKWWKESEYQDTWYFRVGL